MQYLFNNFILFDELNAQDPTQKFIVIYQFNNDLKDKMMICIKSNKIKIRLSFIKDFSDKIVVNCVINDSRIFKPKINLENSFYY